MILISFTNCSKAACILENFTNHSEITTISVLQCTLIQFWFTYLIVFLLSLFLYGSTNHSLTWQRAKFHLSRVSKKVKHNSLVPLWDYE